MQLLRLTEIFHSIQGESLSQGIPTVFIRLTGCPLRCSYCDTSYAFSGGRQTSIKDILQQVTTFACTYITVTGGEPLAQPNCLKLLEQLCEAGYIVSLETSGAFSVAKIDHRVVKVLDVKTPSSKEAGRNLVSNYQYLTSKDQVKFVLGNKDDYLWACDFIQQHQLVSKANILFSPSHGELEPAMLADWILTDKLPVRLQVQLHKYLWGDVAGK